MEVWDSCLGVGVAGQEGGGEGWGGGLRVGWAGRGCVGWEWDMGVLRFGQARRAGRHLGSAAALGN